MNTDMKNNFIRLTLLASLFCNVPGLHLQAQAPHPERIYLSGTGIDNTVTWDFLCSKGQNSGKWKKIANETVVGHCRICRFKEVRAQYFKIVIEKARCFATLERLEAY